MLDPAKHRQYVVCFALLARVFACSLVYASSLALPFDSSPLAVLNPSTVLQSFASSQLRWDAFHFASVAQNGYVYEYQYAFLPGTPGVMRLGASLARWLGLVSWHEGVPALHQLLLSGWVASVLCDSSLSVYDLTLLHTKSTQYAFFSAILSIMATSPATWLVGSYSEPFYAFFALRGLICCAKRQWLFASISFALASLFRSNAILLAGFLIWGLVVKPYITAEQKIPIRSSLYACALAAICAAPFAIHQYNGYRAFCLPNNAEPVREWCSESIPLIYPFVQARYWNSGFLRYWTVAQIPNFLLAAPPLGVLVYSATAHLRIAVPRVWRQTRQRHGAAAESQTNSKRTSASVAAPVPLHISEKPVHAHASPSRPTPPPPYTYTPSDDLEMLPQALHALVLSLILIFASHTQIALRVAPTLPFTHWSVAQLFVRHPKAARVYMAWNVVWWGVSCVLWGSFLPPA